MRNPTKHRSQNFAKAVSRCGRFGCLDLICHGGVDV